MTPSTSSPPVGRASASSSASWGLYCHPPHDNMDGLHRRGWLALQGAARFRERGASAPRAPGAAPGSLSLWCRAQRSLKASLGFDFGSTSTHSSDQVCSVLPAHRLSVQERSLSQPIVQPIATPSTVSRCSSSSWQEISQQFIKEGSHQAAMSWNRHRRDAFRCLHLPHNCCAAHHRRQAASHLAGRSDIRSAAR